jgi:5-methylthioadenosine/S-adenosylhomocysteine deaminase
MNTLFISNALLDGKAVDIRIQDNLFHEIRPHAPARQPSAGETVLDAHGLTALPPFYNTHCHAAMTLLRGYADDLPLQTWLQDHIWPAEAKFTPAHIRAGVRLACLEMIKSGTVGFVDMYMHQDIAAPMVEESGMHALLGVNLFDFMPQEQRDHSLDILTNHRSSDRVRLAIAPHAPYTVSGKHYQELAAFARRLDLKLITHLSETRKEVEDCKAQHGLSPVTWLAELGVLDDNLIAAHCVHVSDEDIRLLAAHQVAISHCPASNLKLASGIAPIARMMQAGCRLTLGTDGAASNNNLNMQESLKLASLLAKAAGDATALPAAEALHLASRAGALAMGIDGGLIEEGRMADLLLVRMDAPQTTPAHSAVSNWVYAAQASQVDTVLCAGRILMQDGRMPHEAAILAEAREMSITHY